MPSGKVLVLYVFHIYNERVQDFIRDATFYDENVDFVMISNTIHVNLTVPSYVKVLYRDNIGFDFGGWSYAILRDSLYKNYDNFIFVNSSVRGPYLPRDFKGRWTDIYIRGLTDTVKLFGSTINTIRDPIRKSHVQSYTFSMDRTTLEYLIACEIFSITKYSNTFLDAVWKKEVLMSRKIIENGWNIGSLLPYYNGVDFTFRDKQPHEYPMEFLDDIMYPRYKGSVWNEYELVFIKGNRIPQV